MGESNQCRRTREDKRGEGHNTFSRVVSHTHTHTGTGAARHNTVVVPRVDSVEHCFTSFGMGHGRVSEGQHRHRHIDQPDQPPRGFSDLRQPHRLARACGALARRELAQEPEAVWGGRRGGRTGGRTGGRRGALKRPAGRGPMGVTRPSGVSVRVTYMCPPPSMTRTHTHTPLQSYMSASTGPRRPPFSQVTNSPGENVSVCWTT